MLTSFSFLQKKKSKNISLNVNLLLKKSENNQNLNMLLDFFEKSYINKTENNVSIKTCNANDRIYKNIPLMTNSLESFNANINSKIRSDNSSLSTHWKCFKNFKTRLKIKKQEL
jgi:hypothetical protein